MVRALIRDLRAVVSPGADLLAGVGAFLAPMAVIGFEPHMGGDTIMFIAANIGYMWGLALGIVSILLVFLVCQRRSRGRFGEISELRNSHPTQRVGL